MREFIVKYQIATYSGEVSVYFDDDYDPDNDEIIAKAKRILRNKVGHFPFGYEKWEVIGQNW